MAQIILEIGTSHVQAGCAFLTCSVQILDAIVVLRPPHVSFVDCQVPIVDHLVITDGYRMVIKHCNKKS